MNKDELLNSLLADLYSKTDEELIDELNKEDIKYEIIPKYNEFNVIKNNTSTLRFFKELGKKMDSEFALESYIDYPVRVDNNHILKLVTNNLIACDMKNNDYKTVGSFSKDNEYDKSDINESDVEAA